MRPLRTARRRAADPARARFLASNNLTEHAYLIDEPADSAPTLSGRRLGQITTLRSQGCSIQFVIESNPNVVTALFAHGIPVLFYLHPQYLHPSFRPDYENPN